MCADSFKKVLQLQCHILTSLQKQQVEMMSSNAIAIIPVFQTTPHATMVMSFIKSHFHFLYHAPRALWGHPWCSGSGSGLDGQQEKRSILRQGHDS